MSNILVLSSSFPRFAGDSAGHFIDNLIDAILKVKRFNFTIIAPWDTKVRLRSERYPDKSVFYFPYFWPRKFHCLAYGDGMIENLRSNMSCIWQIPSYFFSFFLEGLRHLAKAQVIHAHWLIPSGLIGAILARLTGKKLIVTIHGGDLQILRRSFLGIKIIRFIYHRAHVLTTTSEYSRKLLIDILGLQKGETQDKIKMIPMGIDLGDEDKEAGVEPVGFDIKFDSSHENKVVFVGRLIFTKGVDLLLEALRGIKNVHLLLVGKGPQMEYLKMKARELNVSVSFLGHVPPKAVGLILRSCKCLVIPSRDERAGYAEGIPLVLLEAMANRSWVVATSVGGIPEAIHQYPKGILVPPQSPEALRQAILRVFSLADDAVNQDGLETQKALMPYSLNVIAQTWSQVYKNALT